MSRCKLVPVYLNFFVGKLNHPKLSFKTILVTSIFSSLNMSGADLWHFKQVFSMLYNTSNLLCTICRLTLPHTYSSSAHSNTSLKLPDAYTERNIQTQHALFVMAAPCHQMCITLYTSPSLETLHYNFHIIHVGIFLQS